MLKDLLSDEVMKLLEEKLVKKPFEIKITQSENELFKVESSGCQKMILSAVCSTCIGMLKNENEILRKTVLEFMKEEVLRDE